MEKSGNFFKSGKGQGKQAKSGKSQGNHDCAILSASITNSNFTSKSPQNAHICIEVFKIVPGDHTSDSLYWKMDSSTDPTPLTTLRLDFGTARLGSKPSVSRSSIPDPTGKVWENRGISFGLVSGHLI